MKIKLVIDGENQSVKITPDNDADRKLLEFVAEKSTADIEVKRQYDYTDRVIEYINLFLLPPSKEISTTEKVTVSDKIMAILYHLKENISASDMWQSNEVIRMITEKQDIINELLN